MTEERRVIRVYESFVLGFCKCRCGTEIPIRISSDHYLKRYVKGHHMKGRKGRESNGYKGFSYNGDYKLLFRPHHKYCRNGYVDEHRYIIELQSGRYLTKKEVVHHIDGNAKNNDLYNLQLLNSQAEHMAIHNPKLDTSDRRCSRCGSDKTNIEKEYGTPHWYILDNGWVCANCYKKRNDKPKLIIEKICSICGSDTTYIEKSNNKPHWHKINEGYSCQKCYDRIRNKKRNL